MSPKADDSKYTVLVGKMLTCFSYARENHLSKTVFVTCRNDIHKVRGVKISEVVYLQDVSLIKRDYKELTMRITI